MMTTAAPPTASGTARIQALIEQVESVPDPASRQLMGDCLASLLEIYGDGIARIMAHADQAFREKLATDEVVRALLLVHGLHPIPVERRLAEALESVRPYMESHGGDIELVSVEDGVATLRLAGHCKTCPSSSATLELAVRAAIEEACPDLDGIEVEDMAEPTGHEFHLPAGAPQWHILDAAKLNGATLRSLQVDDVPVLICRLGEQRYAYRDHCPACNAPLRGGSLADAVLSCPEGHRYDIRRAGASLDQPALHLDPLPLVAYGGGVKVAV